MLYGDRISRNKEEEVNGGDIVLGKDSAPHPDLYPKLKALNLLHLPVIIGMKISLGGANVEVAIGVIDY